MKIKSITGQERGSLTVEAILFLIPFMCAFLTLVNMARFVQAEVVIHHAITQTAKQISTYSYVMTKTGITAMMQDTNAKSNKFKTDTKKTVDSVTDFFNSVGGLGSGEDVSAGIQDVINKGDTAVDAVSTYLSDPKAIMYGALAAAKSGVRGMAMTQVAGSLARSSIRQSLAELSDDPDQYLRTIGVVDGLAGLDFSGSKWISNEDGSANGRGNVEIVVTYKLKNLLFPDFDFGEREFCQCVSTLTW